MTDSVVRVAPLADGQPGGAAGREVSCPLERTPEDCRRFADFWQRHRPAAEKTVLCIPRTRAGIRFLCFPTHDEGELERMAGYELSALFPYKPEEFVAGYSVLEKAAGGYSRVLFAAVQRQALVWYLDFLKWAQVRPDEVWVSTQALAASYRAAGPREDTCILHADDGFFQLLFFSGSVLVGERCVPSSCPSLTETAVQIERLCAAGYRARRLLVCGPDAGAFAGDIAGLLGVRGERDDRLGVTAARDTAGMAGLLPPELRADRISSARKRSVAALAAMAALNCVLALNLMFVNMVSRRDHLAGLTEKIHVMDTETMALQRKLSRLKALEAASSSGSRKLELLAQLALTCPGQALLQTLDITGSAGDGILTAAGRAKDADAVLRFASALKEARGIDTAEVSFINKRGDAGGWVDFEIKARF